MRAGAEMIPQVACRLGAMLGEGPVWDAARGCLWFVDIKGHKLHRFDPPGGVLDTIEAPEEPSWVIPLAGAALLVGAKAGVHRFEEDAFALLHAVEPDLPGNRLNDAAVHPDGSVWLGTMDNAEEAPSGGYYRFHGSACTALSPQPMVITNGPAFSPDGGTVYLVDTLERVILSASVGADGHPGEARLFARVPDGMGYPDGPVVDSAGTVWVGLFGGWGVARFAPDGTFLGRVEFPVANVTKIAFGGPDLTTVYATTARKGLSADELAAQPHAGDLFTFAVDVPGLAPGYPTA
ncbi:SMP-30/gluconolactonase/LRE family protein [Novosphingobium resinovorum]|uniref:SMP-30/gluconolactonase/LRE family protein n=1 Tax=Novosphingobium TaxID=165696 RepID=UPI001B3C6AA2|nr:MULTISPECIES: SMP-30/gluconolactonase/LRE family protein [Novosphingobium]MBF7014839.1 SMP-30/gluconolactonase/LRE family protein [Novosphingobium sp. HR1a]WJM24679.1 SMP-30/gluconolactonase/LRE family protein [Novosphingobium resinovorum]